MLDELRELYQEVILDHGKRPRNFRKPSRPNCEAMGRNPMCGDQLVIYIEVDEHEVIRDASFLGKGCAISVASASMMTELIIGKTRQQAEALFDGFHEMCTSDDGGAIPEGFEEEYEKLQVLSGVRQFPVRVKCATLAWHTMNAAMHGGREVSTED